MWISLNAFVKLLKSEEPVNHARLRRGETEFPFEGNTSAPQIERLLGDCLIQSLSATTSSESQCPRLGHPPTVMGKSFRI
jgi:hypothetical protein